MTICTMACLALAPKVMDPCVATKSSPEVACCWAGNCKAMEVLSDKKKKKKCINEDLKTKNTPSKCGMNLHLNQTHTGNEI